ncbi:hypothetical protein TNCV_2830251 [Trichonephila clavipes]|nr:hypothetical protein TNCV_2830251 [Trichonephila clavipes]
MSSRIRTKHVMSSSPVPLKTKPCRGTMHVKSVESLEYPPVSVGVVVREEIFLDFNDYVTFADGLPISANEVEEIVDLSEPMNSDSDAEIDSETIIKNVTFFNTYIVRKTVEIYPMKQV